MVSIALIRNYSDKTECLEVTGWLHTFKGAMNTRWKLNMLTSTSRSFSKEIKKTFFF